MSGHRKHEISLLLMGCQGHGKSHTGNTILGRDVFELSDRAVAQAKVRSDWAQRQGKTITVVDGPGLFTTDDAKEAKELTKHCRAAVKSCPGGFHALLLVFSYPVRYTKEEQRTVEALKNMIGRNIFSDFGIIVLTGGDSFEANNKKSPGRTAIEWSRQLGGAFRKLLEEFKDRIVLFHNLEPEKTDKDVQTLLKMVDSMVDRTKGEIKFFPKMGSGTYFLQENDDSTMDTGADDDGFRHVAEPYTGKDTLRKEPTQTRSLVPLAGTSGTLGFGGPEQEPTRSQIEIEIKKKRNQAERLNLEADELELTLQQQKRGPRK